MINWSVSLIPNGEPRKVRKMKSEGQTDLVTTWQDAQSAQTPAPQHTHTHTHLHDSCWVSASLPLSHFLKYTLHSKHVQPFVFISGVKQLAFKQTQLVFSDFLWGNMLSHTHTHTNTHLALSSVIFLSWLFTRCLLMWCHQTDPTQLARPASTHTLRHWTFPDSLQVKLLV